MKIILIALYVLAITALIGCTPAPYETTSNITFENIMPEPKSEIHITKTSDGMLGFEVYHDGNIIELEGYVLRNEDIYENYTNYGNFNTLVFTEVEEGNYIFSAYKNGQSFSHKFNTKDLTQYNIIEVKE